MTFDLSMAQAAALPHLLAQSAGGGSGAQGGSPLGSFTLMIPMLIIMYFVLFRPQRQKQKQAEEMQKALLAGDEVVTVGGAHGVITSLREKTVVVRLVEGKVEFDRSAIATRIPKADAASGNLAPAPSDNEKVTESAKQGK
jgi:preprotein translocase subunit YajC